MTSLSYQRRPVDDADHDFLWRLNVESYRSHVERHWGWDEAWQRNYFEDWLTKDRAVFDLVEVDEQRVGLLELEQRPGLIYVCNLQIVAGHQGRGLGTQILEDVMAEARDRGLDVALQVLLGNDRAVALYERLGFVREGSTETHLQLRWSSEQAD